MGEGWGGGVGLGLGLRRGLGLGVGLGFNVGRQTSLSLHCRCDAALSGTPTAPPTPLAAVEGRELAEEEAPSAVLLGLGLG